VEEMYPEEEEFLVRQPDSVRKRLLGVGLSEGERREMLQSDWPDIFGNARDEYLQLLVRFPARLREYRKRQQKEAAKIAVLSLPSVPSGAPRKDSLAQEALTLKQSGLSHSAIARELNKRHPDLKDRNQNRRSISSEVVRKLLASRRLRTPPDKT
jgi:hypothetical protein